MYDQTNNRHSHSVDSGKPNQDKKYQVLVVDDDHSFRLIARLALGKSNYEVSEAASGEKALELAGQSSFDAIVIDARMPGMDGFETSRQLQSKMGPACPPIILSTGLNDDASIGQAFDAGAADYVTKPLNWRILTGKLNFLVKANDTRKSAQESDKKMEQVLSASASAHLVLDKEAVIRSLRGVESLHSHHSHPFKVGDCLFENVPAESVPNVLSAWKKMLNSGESGPLTISNHDSENPFVIEMRFLSSKPGEAFCFINDCTGNYLTEQRFYNLAFLDRTTGIGNRSRLVDWMNQTTNPNDESENCAVFRFRIENYLDHELRIGRSGLDSLAVMIANRLIRISNPQRLKKEFACEIESAVCRLGESEFGISLVGKFPTTALKTMTEYLLKALTRPIEVDANTIQLDAKAGVADRFCVNADPAELLHCASVVMRLPETPEAGAVCIFNNDSRQALKRQADLEKYLRRDIANRALHMAYQPKVDAKTLKLVCIEALLRWNSAELGFVSPGVFIPLSEQSGLMQDLSELVIEQVLDQLVQWQDSSISGVPVAINISGSSLNSCDFVRDLASQIEKRRISPELIELEVTESIMIDTRSRAIHNLHKLREHGIKISVDDFGTGYSSFSYLSSLPVDVLKIDRSFVSQINEDPKSQAIAKAIITVGQELGLEVVAEGIETQDQLITLRDMGCHTIQGYFTGRPVVAQDIFQEAKTALLAAAG